MKTFNEQLESDNGEIEISRRNYNGKNILDNIIILTGCVSTLIGIAYGGFYGLKTLQGMNSVPVAPYRSHFYSALTGFTIGTVSLGLAASANNRVIKREEERADLLSRINNSKHTFKN